MEEVGIKCRPRSMERCENGNRSGCNPVAGHPWRFESFPLHQIKVFKNMANILLVDASPLIYANYNAMKRFKTKAGVSTGLRFGFMRSMRSYVEKTQADRVAICLDLPGPVKKAEGVEDYKANRAWTEEKQEMYDQVPDLMTMLSYTRYARVQAEGYEADDVIAFLARKFAKANHSVYIVSPDNDLLQLVNDKIQIWMPPKKKEKAWFKDKDYCLDKFGVYPEDLLYFRAAIGDSSDNLKGCVTPGNKSALVEMIHTKKTLRKEELTVFELLESVPSFWLWADWQEIYRRNVEIMRLHDPKDGELVITKGEKDPDALRKLFFELEMKSLVSYVGKYTGIEELGLNVKSA